MISKSESIVSNMKYILDLENLINRVLCEEDRVKVTIGNSIWVEYFGFLESEYITSSEIHELSIMISKIEDKIGRHFSNEEKEAFTRLYELEKEVFKF